MRYLLPLLLLAFTGRAAFFDQWDRDAYAWRNAVVTNASSVSGSAYNTATRFGQHVKQFGLRYQIVNCGIYLGTDLNAVLIAFIHDLGNVRVVNNNFVSGDYTEATGLTGNTTTKVLRPNFAMSTVGSLAHLAIYSRTASDENASQIGAQDAGAGTGCYLLQSYVDGNTYATINGVITPSGQFSAADSAGLGFYVGSRTAVDAAAIYKNGVRIALNSTDLTPAAAPPEELAIHALNNNGAFALWTAKTLSFWSAGGGLNANQQGALYHAVQRIQSDFKRQK